MANTIVGYDELSNDQRAFMDTMLDRLIERFADTPVASFLPAGCGVSANQVERDRTRRFLISLIHINYLRLICEGPPITDDSRLWWEVRRPNSDPPEWRRV